MQTAITQHTSATSVRDFSASVPGKIVFGLASTLIVAAAAHVAIPLPFTPVPLTLQPLAVLGVGLALGPITGFLVMVAYLMEGLAGLPVFSPTGLGGALQLFGPTGGFLLAYPLVAAVSGGVTRLLAARTQCFVAAALACAAAVCLLFVSGAAWLMHFGHLSLQQTWIAGVAPFLPGEAVKVLVAAGIYSALARRTQS